MPRALLFFSFFLFVPGRLAAGGGGGAFHEPARLTGGGGKASEPGAALLGSTLLVAHLEGGSLVLRVGSPGSEPPVTISPAVASGAAPRVAVGDLGRISVLYVSRPPGGDPALLLAERISGDFEAAREIASGLALSPSHALAHGARGDLHLLWLAGGSLPEVVLRKGLRDIVLGPGERPALAEGPLGFTYVSYIRGGSVFHRTDRDADDFSVERSLPPAEGALDLALAVDGSEVLHWLIETGEGLRHIALGPGGEPAMDAGAIPGSLPAIAASGSGAALAVFQRGGALHAARIDAGSAGMGPAEIIFTPRPGETIPSHEVKADPAGHFHIAFESAGEIYATNDIPPPEPLFRVDRTEARQGEPVAFEDLSQGLITSRRWDFGDGSTDEGSHPSHAYVEPGLYAVSLEVAGPGGSRAYRLPERVRVLPALNILEIPAARVHPSRPAFSVPVLLTSRIPSKGFQVVLEPSANLEWLGWSYPGTATQALQAELIRVEVEEAPPRRAVVGAVLWDFEGPFDGRVLPPVERQALLLFEFALGSGALPGVSESIRFVNGFGPQEKSNILVSGDGSESVFPFTRDGRVEPAAPDSMDGAFLRGDTNRDGEIDISDAIETLSYLFLGEAAPSCLDAADQNDDGLIDLADAIDTLYFLFGGGRYPVYPYPDEGLDGTEDLFPPCSEEP